MSTNPLICVVDDDPSMLRMLVRTVAAKGFEVAAFSSAEELLDSGRIDDFACLIIDVDLPGIGGLELQQKLKNNGQSVPVILISGEATEKMRQRALNQGAVAFFDKPFSIESLLAAVRSVQTLMLA